MNKLAQQVQVAVEGAFPHIDVTETTTVNNTTTLGFTLGGERFSVACTEHLDGTPLAIELTDGPDYGLLGFPLAIEQLVRDLEPVDLAGLIAREAAGSRLN